LWHVKIQVSDIFSYPTLKDLVDFVDAQRPSQEDAIIPLPIAEYYQLSAAQHRMWILTQLDGANKAYHIRLAIRLTGKVDHVLFNEAFQNLLQRHEILRTVFIQDQEGKPWQKIREWSPENYVLDYRDFSHAEEERKLYVGF
jgi:tyrocidine synthetase-3